MYLIINLSSIFSAEETILH